MKHLLDNPAYHALVSGNRNLAHGTGEVQYFSRDVSPFVGLKENTAGNLRLLANILPDPGKRAVVHQSPLDLPSCWKVFEAVPVFQMTFTAGGGETPAEQLITTLGERDVPAMLALTRLTRPGPFDPQTLLFGHYRGIFLDGHLAAMAGQRMHPVPYAEISAVCTHPAYRGQGLARALILDQVARILAAREVPMMHVKTDNDSAIRLYEHMGFTIRAAMTVTILERPSGAERGAPAGAADLAEK